MGDYGLSEPRYGRPDQTDHHRLFQAIETLRAAFASLLAGVIKYHGPVSLRLSDDRRKIDLHYPLQISTSHDSANDKVVAAKLFHASHEDSPAITSE